MADFPPDRPWFLYVHLWEMHRPRYVPRGFERRRFGRHRYERALSALDQERFPRLFERAGERTVVAVTGDHGEIPRFDRLHRVAFRPVKRYVDRRSGHGHDVVEDLVLVPLLLAGPGVPAGGVVRTAVRHMDLFPTLLELAGVRDPRVEAQAAGESLVPLFERDGGDRPGYAEAVGVTIGTEDNWLVSVRHEGFKYVRRANGEGAWLWKLPDEQTDVSGRYPDVVARMEGLLDRFRESRAMTATGQELSEQESREVADHLRELGYLD